MSAKEFLKSVTILPQIW